MPPRSLRASKAVTSVLPEAAQVAFLVDAAHLMSVKDPAMAAYLGRRALKVSQAKKVPLPKGAAQKLCHRCGAVLQLSDATGVKVVRLSHGHRRRQVQQQSGTVTTRGGRPPTINAAAVVRTCQLCGDATTLQYATADAARAAADRLFGVTVAAAPSAMPAGQRAAPRARPVPRTAAAVAYCPVLVQVDAGTERDRATISPDTAAALPAEISVQAQPEAVSAPQPAGPLEAAVADAQDGASTDIPGGAPSVSAFGVAFPAVPVDVTPLPDHSRLPEGDPAVRPLDEPSAPPSADAMLPAEQLGAALAVQGEPAVKLSTTAAPGHVPGSASEQVVSPADAAALPLDSGGQPGLLLPPNSENLGPCTVSRNADAAQTELAQTANTRSQLPLSVSSWQGNVEAIASAAAGHPPPDASTTDGAAVQMDGSSGGRRSAQDGVKAAVPAGLSAPAKPAASSAGISAAQQHTQQRGTLIAMHIACDDKQTASPTRDEAAAKPAPRAALHQQKPPQVTGMEQTLPPAVKAAVMTSSATPPGADTALTLASSPDVEALETEAVPARAASATSSDQPTAAAEPEAAAPLRLEQMAVTAATVPRTLAPSRRAAKRQRRRQREAAEKRAASAVPAAVSMELAAVLPAAAVTHAAVRKPVKRPRTEPAPPP